MITIPNIDGHMWDADIKAVDLINEYHSTGKIQISLNSEGPDANELGLYKLLDYICNTQHIDKKLVSVHTCNLLEAHPDYQIVKTPPMHFVTPATKIGNMHKNITKHFGLFVGRSNWIRLWISSEMFNNYQQQTVQTFHYDPASDFHKTHLGVDRVLSELREQCNIGAVAKLISHAPVSINAVNTFPILMPAHWDIVDSYNEFLVDIVCETYITGNSFFPTEKIWRPIACKTPFLMQGPVGYLKNLRRLGFKTFDRYWDESYDEDGQILGTKTILYNINRLSKMSTSELQTMYNDMMPILEHNRATLMSLTPKSFDIFK